ncbi:hypothetical protein ACG2F4_05840 [Halalkalibaculum sp. DA3122]|uniref:hypothetical protein n=1 Tax=unclassified Halalkalibaculum TaxID=2964617 RepID=UPI0037551177
MNEEILENLNKRLDDALDRGRQIVDDDELAERIEELKLRAESVIRENPIKSVAGGLLIGYIIGKMLSSGEE